MNLAVFAYWHDRLPLLMHNEAGREKALEIQMAKKYTGITKALGGRLS